MLSNSSSTELDSPAIKSTQTSGPWPFVTHVVDFLENGRTRVWSARHHRKGLLLPTQVPFVSWAAILARALWMPTKLNWYIGIIFALGASLFALGSILTLWPSTARIFSLAQAQVNAIFFMGSIPFTLAAYLQLYQSANAPGSSRRVWVGFQPRDLGWLSCLLQFVGTIFFNFNTWDAMMPTLSWFQQDLLIWIPNFFGSILFLVSGYLAMMEIGHSYWSWKPGELSWWLVTINFLGCIGFMVSAILSIALPGPVHEAVLRIAVLFTLQGAICFLVGSLLLMVEAGFQQPSGQSHSQDKTS